MAAEPAAQAKSVLAQSKANLRKAHRKALTEAAKAARKEFVAGAKTAAPKRRVRGKLLGASYRVKTSGDTGTATLKATGPWHLIEQPTKAHTIRPRSKRALKTPHGAYARVQHPGTKGKKPWAKTVPKIPSNSARILADRYIKEVGSAWGS